MAKRKGTTKSKTVTTKKKNGPTTGTKTTTPKQVEKVKQSTTTSNKPATTSKRQQNNSSVPVDEKITKIGTTTTTNTTKSTTITGTNKMDDKKLSKYSEKCFNNLDNNNINHTNLYNNNNHPKFEDQSIQFHPKTANLINDLVITTINQTPQNTTPHRCCDDSKTNGNNNNNNEIDKKSSEHPNINVNFNNNNNNNSKEISNDKYLHKKFKRPASARTVDNSSHNPNILVVHQNLLTDTNNTSEIQNHRLSIDSLIHNSDDGGGSSNNLNKIHNNNSDKIHENSQSIGSDIRREILNNSIHPNNEKSHLTINGYNLNTINNHQRNNYKDLLIQNDKTSIPQNLIYQQREEFQNKLNHSNSDLKILNNNMPPFLINSEQQLLTKFKPEKQLQILLEDNNLVSPVINNNNNRIISTNCSTTTISSTNNLQKNSTNIQSTTIPQQQVVLQSIDTNHNHQQSTNSTTGRHVCPYCNLNCTKPSVLQKHIRAHTNERPYPCDKCGIAFKTNSNYYKHCRSRSHLQRMKGVVDPQPNDDEQSLESDPDPDQSNSSSDVISGTVSPHDDRTSSPAVQNQQQQLLQHQQKSSSSSISSNSSTSSSVQKNSNDKPYKPKFHNAALYKDDQFKTHTTTLYHPPHHQYVQQNQHLSPISSMPLPYINKQNQITVLSTTTNHHNINNPETYYSSNVPSPSPSHSVLQIPQQQDQSRHQYYQQHQQLLSLQSSEKSHQHQNHHQRSQIGANSESAPPPSSNLPFLPQQSHRQRYNNHQQHNHSHSHSHSQQQILNHQTSSSPSSFQQVVAPAYNSDSMRATSPLVGKDSTGSIIISNTGGNTNAIGNVSSAVPTSSYHQLNVEFLQEHISKLISQNQAIVENKEVLLQKKYPKQLNKQKSLSSLVIPPSSTTANSDIMPSTVSATAITPNTIPRPQFGFGNKHNQSNLAIQREENRNPQTLMNGIIMPPKNISSPATSTMRLQNNQNNKNLTMPSQELSFFSQQPLNLSKLPEQSQINTEMQLQLPIQSVPNRKRSLEETPVATTSATKTLATHPQNPERSIIKHLLLNARGLGVPNGEGEDAVYTCPLCKLDFQTAEELKLHTSQYCQGGPSSAPISPVSSPSYKYFRSNSINVNFPELNNPTSLASLAKSSLLHGKNPLPLAKLAFYQLKTKSSNLILNQLNVSTSNAAVASSSGLSSKSDSITDLNAAATQKLIDAPLPSPGPLLGKTPLVEDYNATCNYERKSEDVVITKVHEVRNYPIKEYYTTTTKKLKYDNSYSVNNNNSGSTVIYSPIHGQSFSDLESNDLDRNYKTSFDSQLSQKPPAFLLCENDINTIDKKEQNMMKRFMSSGGCIVPITENENSPKYFRTQLRSGGSFTEVNLVSPRQHPSSESPLHYPQPMSQLAPKMMIPIAPLTPTLPPRNILNAGFPLSAQHFQFPPINSITAFNPLTLPPISLAVSPVLPCGEKVIPYVPGIPGPNSLLPLPPPPQRIIDFNHHLASPSRKNTASPLVQGSGTTDKQNHQQNYSISRQQQYNDVQSSAPAIITSVDFSGLNTRPSSELQRSPKNASTWTPHVAVESNKKTFNFSRIADNLSPKKPKKSQTVQKLSAEKEIRHFNFENIPEIKTEFKNENYQPLHVDCPSTVSLQNIVTTAPKIITVDSSLQIPEEKPSSKKSKFLRPTSLPLKPGTFTPKRHHGITPTANTMPLISPETPRPSKTCGQMFLNGHAYTYLGLKCSTKMFYCTVNCPQPSYVANLHKLSMYSVWQVQAEKNVHPLGLKSKTVMGLYDSRQRVSGISMANIKLPYTSVHSQHTVMTPFENNSDQFYHHQIKSLPPDPTPAPLVELTNSQDQAAASTSSSNSSSSKLDCQKAPMLVGGYESNEDYTYIRGRGRGKYVCSECGIRCKKPSMLVKHIRTHSDVRPYRCSHCNFSFKTKGNLTKHMQSKAHYKKCLELGVDPGEGLNGEFVDREGDNDQQSITSGNGRTSSIPGESDSEDGSDGDERETESSDTDESKSRLPEHEAARCLLSLSMTPPSTSVSPHYRSGSVSANGENDKTQLNVEKSVTPSKQLDDIQKQQTLAIAARRVISFTSPKPPFDYQKQEKYYSNPSTILPKSREDEKFDENVMKPIDLTKPRNQTCADSSHVPHDHSKITNVIGNLQNESGFHKSLLSITEKIRTSTDTIEFSTSAHHNSEKNKDDTLLQAYLTEQALQYTKIKQSQMSSNSCFKIDNACSTSTPTTPILPTVGGNSNPFYSNSDLSSNRMPSITTVSVTTSSPSMTMTSTTMMSPGIVTSHKTNQGESIEISKRIPRQSKEIALDMPILTDSSDTKLQECSSSTNSTEFIKKSSGEPPLKKNNNSAVGKVVENVETVKDAVKSISSETTRDSGSTKQKGSAKSVASEYLKMTQKTKQNKPKVLEESPDEESTDHEIQPTSNLSTVVSSENANAKAPTDFNGILARTVIVGEDGFKNFTPSNETQKTRVPISEDNVRPMCIICSKTFQKQHQYVLHMNIHYMERKFKCEPCAVSFRTQGHLQKHERSEAHKNKVMMTSTFGIPTTSNPRPYECSDCKVAFRIHGHLAKHLRSKTHVQKLECSQKLPFGTYAEIEKAGISLTEIDTTDCDNSLASLKVLAQKLFEKDPNKLSSYTTPSGMENSANQDPNNESGSEGNPDVLDENPANPLPSSVPIKNHEDLNLNGPKPDGGVNRIGLKRKFESFSSCSNDSTTLSGSNSTSTGLTDDPITSEKRSRTRTTSETK